MFPYETVFAFELKHEIPTQQTSGCEEKVNNLHFAR